MAASASLLFGIVRIEWRVKCIGISHWSSELEFSAKGAVLKDGEEGVQFGEVGALRGLLALDGFDDGGEAALKGNRWIHQANTSDIVEVETCLHCGAIKTHKLSLAPSRCNLMTYEGWIHGAKSQNR